MEEVESDIGKYNPKEAQGDIPIVGAREGMEMGELV